MDPNHAAFLQFREVVHAAAPLSDAHQFLVLQIELLHALERANRSQHRSRVLELELGRLRSRTAIRNEEPHLHHAELERQLAEVRRELAKSKADGQEQLRAMRLEVLAMELQCEELDEVCRSLLLTIERAACPELGAATEPGRKAGVSA
jgi:hypothetical protein